MKNELFSIGPITIYGYGLMIAIGVLAAYFSATYRSKKYALDPDKVFYVTVWAVNRLHAPVLRYPMHNRIY